jgi:hypothetical protein
MFNPPSFDTTEFNGNTLKERFPVVFEDSNILSLS